MAGLKGQVREPRQDPRARRNSQNLSALVSFIGSPSVVSLEDGVLVITIGDGLDDTGDTLVVDLASDPGLEFSSGDLRVKIKASGGVVRDSDGLSLSAATESVAGAVLLQGLVADAEVLSDSSGGTSGSGTIAAVGIDVTDPGDAPADADALRDDLVDNTIPSIETELSNLRNAVATLAAYSTDLEDKINEMIAAQKTALQMNTA